MDPLISFLYQFVGGAVVLLVGMFGALRVGALDLSQKKDRVWTGAIFGVVLLYFVVQGLFQFVLSRG